MSDSSVPGLLWFSENIHALSGYSDEGRVFVRGLKKSDVDIRILGKNRRPQIIEFDFVSENDPRIPVVYHTYRHGRYNLLPGQYSITRTMLEVDRIPRSWARRFRHLAEIWVPSPFMAAVFEQSGVERERIFVVPSPVDSVEDGGGPAADPSDSEKFVFLTLFDWKAKHRKGLDILLRAYREEFTPQENVELVIKSKTTMRELRKMYRLPTALPPIRIVNETLDRRRLISLYRRIHCFVLPTRGEGIGRPFLDAMQTGTPIIATAWGGHCDFLNEKNSFPIKYRLTDVAPEYYLYNPGFFGARWAEPDLEDLKIQMRRVKDNRNESAVKTRRALQEVKRFTALQVCNEILRRLENPLGLPDRTRPAPNLFSRLFPIHYPGNPGRDEIRRLSEADFKRPVNSVAVAGAGSALRRAVDFVTRVVGLKNIVFLDLGDDSRIPANLATVPLRDFNPGTHRVDALILACHVEEVADFYTTILNHLDSVPVYVFD